MKTSNLWKTQLLLGTVLLILTVSPSTPAPGQTLHSAPAHRTVNAAFDARPVAQVEIGTFRFVPGFPGRVHTHKAPVFGYVSKGVVNYYLEDRKLTLHAGDVFYEPVGPRIRFENASSSEPAVFTDFNLERVGEPSIVIPPRAAQVPVDRTALPTVALKGLLVDGFTGYVRNLSGEGVTFSQGAVFGLVQAGAVTVTVNGAETAQYDPGQSFYAPAGVKALVTSSTAVSAKVAFFPLHTLATSDGGVAASARIHYRNLQVGDVNVFYREAGPANAPAVLLLHGWGASSFMFRDLVPILATRYHVIAPDLPGFGLTQAPPREKFAYNFDHLSSVINQFTEQLQLDHYAIYVFDYGAPTGYRLALLHPERVTAIISQNGNAYVEGLSSGWDPIKKYWSEPTQANRDALRAFMTLDTNRWQYLQGVHDPTLVEPEAYLLSQAGFDKPGNLDVQLDLFGDYKSNVALYPTFQNYFRTQKPPLLAVWGKNDPFFLPAGAEAYKRDDPNAEVYFFDTGHLALETHNDEIAAVIVNFLNRYIGQ